MRRPAVVLLGVGFVACWHGSGPRQATIGNQAGSQAAAAGLPGPYLCTITEQSFKYPPFPCAIRQGDHELVLAKLAGSVRFEGQIRPEGDGYAFVGRLYCPFGDCTEQVAGTFRSTPDGGLRGTLGADRLVVELHRFDGGFGVQGYGGAGYGGAGYGGAGYGGAMYGGAGYGGALPPPPPAPSGNSSP